MARRREYDPLVWVPSPDTVRPLLAEAETRAERLRILLRIAEELHLPLARGSELAGPAGPRPAGPPAPAR